jgi:hypothetical protein
MRLPSVPLTALLLASWLSCTGCTTTKQTNTARTASEQLLISNAVDHALNKVDFQGLVGQKILIDEKYLDCVDKGYLVGSLRDRVVRSGAHLVAKAEEADIVLEVRSGGVGTDLSNSFAGMPGITLPGMLSIPEIRLVSRDRQKGLAKIGLVAYDAKTMQILGGGGIATSISDDNNWYVFGVGPYRTGSVKNEINGVAPMQPGDTPVDYQTRLTFAPPGSPRGDAPGSASVQNVSSVKANPFVP